MTSLRLVLAAIAVSVCIAPAQAALVDAEVPENAFITFGGLDWAWARPLPGGLDLSFQAQFGWRFPTLQELASAPDATDFMFSGANVPLGGTDPVSGARFQFTNTNLVGDAACAAPYFNSTFSHCDWGEGNGQPFAPWAGSPGAGTSAEQLAVRNSSTSTPIPIPASALLLIGGLAALGVARRKAA